MYLYTFFSGFAIFAFITYYSKFVRKIFKDLEDDEDEICYTKHPMSESESESESESDEEDLSEDEDVEFHYHEKETKKEMPCYMKDFYEETTLSREWLEKTEEEKKKILDKELDEYTQEQLRRISC